MLSDFYPHGKVSKKYGVFNEELGTARRAVVVVDKQGTVRFSRVYASASDLDLSDVLAEVSSL